MDLAEQIKQLIIKQKIQFQEGYAGLNDITFYIQEYADPDLTINVKYNEITVNGNTCNIEEVKNIIQSY